jgi:hypothetical protein
MHAVLAVSLKALEQRGRRIAVTGPAFEGVKPIRCNKWRRMLHGSDLQLSRRAHVPEEAAGANNLEPCVQRQARGAEHPATEVLLHRRPFSFRFVCLGLQGKQKRLSKDLHVSRGYSVTIGVRASVNALTQKVISQMMPMSRCHYSTRSWCVGDLTFITKCDHASSLIPLSPLVVNPNASSKPSPQSSCATRRELSDDV